MKKKRYPKKGDLVKIDFSGLEGLKLSDIPFQNNTGVVLRTVKLFQFGEISRIYNKPEPKTYIVFVDGKEQFIKAKYLRILND
ncbi:MAG: hypothetical protein ACXADH_14485 [Candidatus Kariarchaeaceae archaeon]|jgi:hypothetical protein